MGVFGEGFLEDWKKDPVYSGKKYGQVSVSDLASGKAFLIPYSNYM